MKQLNNWDLVSLSDEDLLAVYHSDPCYDLDVCTEICDRCERLDEWEANGDGDSDWERIINECVDALEERGNGLV